MTGAEHYREAERLLGEARVDVGDGEFVFDESPTAAVTVAAAQVHASLAVAAATAWPTTPDGGRVQGYGVERGPR